MLPQNDRESPLRLVAGLGNPGPKYAETRHNLGFRVCEKLSAALGAEFHREKFEALAAEARTPRGKVILLEPQTFMNLSGVAVASAVRFYRLDLQQVLVVCDDFNLDLGLLRFRRGGSHGGHNGLKDVIEKLGDEAFPRLRLGTGPLAGRDAVAFCLSRFEPGERECVTEMVDRAAEAVRVWLESGIDGAMNRYNAKVSDNP